MTAAAHMLLMEPAWNPSLDAQAQACVWHLGQTKPCFITRVVYAGCLEEKILQRQAYKQGLRKQGLEMADVEQKQLKDIWFFEPNAACTTWESLPKEASQAEMHGLAWRGAQIGCPGYFIMTSSTSAPSPSPAGKAAPEPALTAKPPKKRPAPSDAGDASGEDDMSLQTLFASSPAPGFGLGLTE